MREAIEETSPMMAAASAMIPMDWNRGDVQLKVQPGREPRTADVLDGPVQLAF